MVIEWPTGKITTTLKEVEEFMIPPDGVKQKLDEGVDSIPSVKGCEVQWRIQTRATRARPGLPGSDSQS